MNPAQPDSSKRPRLSTASSWASGAPHGAFSLPPPPPMSSGPQHPGPPRPYQPHYPRAPESHPPPPPPQVSPLHTPRPGQHHQHPDDRRHHEHDQFAPMQDFRQPPPSPAQVPPPHGAQPSNAFPGAYPAREPGIKRESTDEHAAAPRRPPSTGSGPESQAHHPPPMNPGAHPPSTAPPSTGPHHPYPLEDARRHVSFDAGPPVPGTPGPYGRPSSFPPPGSVTHQHPYESVYSNDPYYGVQYASSSKKKTTRASQACDSCRALKAKCDETKPCKNCREKNVECKYREPAPKPTDKAQADIMDGVNRVAQMLSRSMEDQHRSMEDQRKLAKRIERLENALLQVNPQLDLKCEVSSEDDKSISLQEQHRINVPANDVYSDHTHAALYDMADEEVEKEPGPVVSPGQPSIPTNHTTGAGHLINWACINDLLHEALRKEGVQQPAGFPILQEERRGILRVYGRGEGRDPVLRDRDSRTIHGSAEIPDDAYLDINSPTPGDSSGFIGGFSPGNVSDYTTSSPRGPVNQSGIPDFSEKVVMEYVRSFEKNILNMHPIILPNTLRTMVQYFLNSIPKQSKAFNPTHTSSFVPQSPQSSALELAGSKRKRSPGADMPDTPQLQHRVGRPTRTINNAVVLTILALGKICLHRDYVPDVIHDDERPRNGYPGSPHASSPEAYTPSAPYTSTMMSPKTAERPGFSRRPSFQGVKAGSQLRRNYDVIPGLEYFAIATDIIGNQMGGNTLNHVYASIFAGLYQGQLGRVIESHAYIAHGCTVLMNVLRPSLQKFYKIANGDPGPLSTRDNQLLFAFWTCLQLESDIIAEIPRHQSGISAHEENMPYPDIASWVNSWQGHEGNEKEKEYVTGLVESYAAQLYLRKHLNQIHRMIYSENNPSSADLQSTLRNLNEAQRRVETMEWVAENFRFNTDDPPADNILSARLRAKFYGAQVITYRPCIKMILELSFNLRREAAGSTGQMVQTLEEVPRDIVRKVEALGHEVWNHARKGVRALVQSTQAFHGLGDKRPIITNVFGTAHAQWGNLLVLSACYCDPFLRSEIQGDKLKDLFRRTLSFLKQSSTQSSSALRIDARLLESLYQKIFMEAPPVTVQPKASSSTASGPTPGQPQLSHLESIHGQGNVLEPMGPPDHGGMMVPPSLPVGPPPPGRQMMSAIATQGDAVGPVQAAPMVPGPVGLAPIEPEQPAIAPPHQPNIMQ